VPWHQTGSDEADYNPDCSEKRIPPNATRTTLRYQRNDQPDNRANSRTANGVKDKEDDDEDRGSKDHVDILTLALYWIST
jgi:hypothetical protein